jgi:hypothetical protein
MISFTLNTLKQLIAIFSFRKITQCSKKATGIAAAVTHTTLPKEKRVLDAGKIKMTMHLISRLIRASMIIHFQRA